MTDHTEMRRLASIYCSAVDDGDVARMAGLFVSDGKLVVYPPGAPPESATPMRTWHGEDGFGRLLSVLAQTYVRWVHFLGNHWVEADGELARGEAYLFACHLRRGAGGVEEEEVAIIRYRDSYIRTDTGWRFRERQAFRQWTTLRPLNAGQHLIDAALHGAAAAQRQS